MRAIQVLEYGGREQLTASEIAVPEPGKGEVRVRLAYAGVNFIDVYMRNGLYAKNRAYGSTLPLTLGMEGAGLVDAIGEGVEGLSQGDRVAYCLSAGSYAEYAVVPAWKLVPVPEDIGLDLAAAMMLQGCTGHYLTHSLFPLEPGQTCLIHAGAGGVGQVLIQLAKARGGRVLTTVGSPEKAETARGLGADEVILYKEADFKEAVHDLTGGQGVHVVYESVGKDTFERSLFCLRHRGTCVLFGFSSGAVTSVNPQSLAEAGSVFLTRPNLADYMANEDEIAGRAGDLFGMMGAGDLQLEICEILDLEDAASAHAALEGRATTGKLLLKTESGR
jgi:NADPH2:quinone reductase